MSRFFPSPKRSLDSLLNLITDLVADGLLFFRLLFRSRTALSAEILFLRKQLAFYAERQVQPRRLYKWHKRIPKVFVRSSGCAIASEAPSHRSSKTYSCCASRMVKVRLGPDPTTNSKPIAPGTIVQSRRLSIHPAICGQC